MDSNRLLIKISNGIIVQWGKTTTRTSNGVLSVTFPIAFSSTNYAIADGNVVNQTTQESGAITTYSKTGFSITAWNARASMWVAIGY